MVIPFIREFEKEKPRKWRWDVVGAGGGENFEHRSVLSTAIAVPCYRGWPLSFLISSILRDISGSLQCLPFAQLHNCTSLKLHSVVFAPRWRLRCAHCWTLHTAQSGFEIGICNSASLPIYKSSVDSTLWRQCASLPIYKSWLRISNEKLGSRMKISIIRRCCLSTRSLLLSAMRAMKIFTLGRFKGIGGL